MNWKDTLRKAPFSVGDEQGKAREELALKKKELLKELQLFLEQGDEPFRNQIRRNPEARAYTLQLQNTPFFPKLMGLMGGNKLKNLEVEEHLIDEYDVDDVVLDYNVKTITFEK